MNIDYEIMAKEDTGNSNLAVDGSREYPRTFTVQTEKNTVFKPYEFRYVVELNAPFINKWQDLDIGLFFTKDIENGILFEPIYEGKPIYSASDIIRDMTFFKRTRIEPVIILNGHRDPKVFIFRLCVRGDVEINNKNWLNVVVRDDLSCFEKINISAGGTLSLQSN